MSAATPDPEFLSDRYAHLVVDGKENIRVCPYCWELLDDDSGLITICTTCGEDKGLW